MKSKIRLIVHKQGSEYFATRVFPDNTDISPPNVVFTMEREITPQEIEQLHEDAKAEARKRGIAHVINLD